MADPTLKTASAEALRDDAALVDRGAYQVVTLTGGDRVTFLHRLLTANVEGLAEGQGRVALLLTVKGQIVVSMQVCRGADNVRLVLPPGAGPTAVTALSRYAIMDDVVLTPEPALVPLVIHGAGAARRLGEVGLDVTGLPPATVDVVTHGEVAGPGGSYWVIRSPGLGSEGFWVFGPEDRIQSLKAALSARGVGLLPEEAAEALRILAGEPRPRTEITDDVFPMEVGLDRAIDYAKGCYLGQEPIVRIRDRGHINWRLVGLRLREDGPVAAGDKLETDARPKAGRITSVSRLPGGLPVALALLHVSVPLGATVRVRSQEQALAAEAVAAEP
jgi:folate-binding protein YgfZ